MGAISETSSTNTEWQQPRDPQEGVRLQIFSSPCSTEQIVKDLASIEGAVDIYCWYEGSRCLPKLGAEFMKNYLFAPLWKLKKNTKIYLYSLRAWDFKRNVVQMAPSTPLGDAINRINTVVVECIYSASFFKYCTQENRLYALIKEDQERRG